MQRSSPGLYDIPLWTHAPEEELDEELDEELEEELLEEEVVLAQYEFILFLFTQ